MRLPRMTTRRWILAVVVVALLLGAERIVERRAYFLTRAEVEADRAGDFIRGGVCLREEFDKEGMYEKLRDHYLALRGSTDSPQIGLGSPSNPTRISRRRDTLRNNGYPALASRLIPLPNRAHGRASGSRQSRRSLQFQEANSRPFQRRYSRIPGSGSRPRSGSAQPRGSHCSSPHRRGLSASSSDLQIIRSRFLYPPTPECPRQL